MLTPHSEFKKSIKAIIRFPALFKEFVMLKARRVFFRAKSRQQRRQSRCPPGFVRQDTLFSVILLIICEFPG
jgi:hypothetical protein